MALGQNQLLASEAGVDKEATEAERAPGVELVGAESASTILAMSLKRHFENAHLVLPPLLKARLGRSGVGFDFAVLSFGNVGTMAVNTLIDDHPQVCLPYYDDSVQILCGRQAPPRGEVNGLIFHFPFEVKTVRRLIRARVKRDVLLQFVREPASNAHSMYNRQLFIACIKGEPGPSFEQFLGRKKLLQHLLPFASASSVARHFARWEVIDLPEIFPDAIDDTLQRIFQLIGVRSDMRIADSKRRFANDFEMYLYYALGDGMPLDLRGSELRVRISIERGLSPRGRFDVEVFRRHVLSAYVDADRRVIFHARRDDWNRLAPGMRAQLVDDAALQQEGAERCLRELEQRYDDFLPKYQRVKLESLSHSQRQSLAQRVGADTNKMRQRFEHLREAWPETLSP